MHIDSDEKGLLCSAREQRKVIPELHVTRKVRPIEYVIDENECWKVVSHRSSNGQGGPSVRRNGKRMLISRYVYELMIGPIGKYDLLVNTCGCKTCCNPAHYEIRDKGYFNTFGYMLTYNPEHYDNLRRGCRTRKRSCRFGDIGDIRRILEAIDRSFD